MPIGEVYIDKYMKKYLASAKGKAARDKYNKSGKGKAARERYLNSEKGKAAALKYRLSKKGKKTQDKQRSKTGVLKECSKWLENNPGKTPQDFFKEVVSVRTAKPGRVPAKPSK